jgi:hypothetical protein
MIGREHTWDDMCWCKPVIIFNAGKNYGKVRVHRKNTLVKHKDPGADTLQLAVTKALVNREDIDLMEA